MATNRWLGAAAAVAQVDTFTPANVEIDDVFTLTVTGEDGSTASVSFTATAATVANVTAGLVAAWNASTNPLCTPVTAEDGTTELTLTADTAGVPFYVEASVTNGGSTNDQTLTRTATTPNSGPNDYNVADNWSLGAVPVATNDVYIESGSANILYGLNQSGVALASFNVSKAYTGLVGQSAIPLRISASIASLGYYYGSGLVSGSQRLNLDFGSTACAIEIRGSAATSTDTGLQPMRIIANSADTTLVIHGGIVGIATNYAGETATIKSIDIGAAIVTVGEGVTLTTFSQTGGDNILLAGATTLNVFSGNLLKVGDGNVTTVNVYGGELNFQGSGTIGTCNVFDGMAYLSSSGTVTNLNVSGKADMSGSPTARTITNCNIHSGSELIANNAAVTFTNGVTLVGCTIDKCELDFGYGVTLAIS